MKTSFLKASNKLKGRSYPQNIDPEYDQLHLQTDRLGQSSHALAEHLILLQNHLKGVALTLQHISSDFGVIYSQLGVQQDPDTTVLLNQLKQSSNDFNDSAYLLTGRLQDSVLLPAADYYKAQSHLVTLHKDRQNALFEYQYATDKYQRTKMKQKTKNLTENQQRAIEKQQQYSTLNEQAKADKRQLVQQTPPIYDKILNNLAISIKEFGTSLANSMSRMTLPNNQIMSVPRLNLSSHLYTQPVQPQTATAIETSTLSYPGTTYLPINQTYLTTQPPYGYQPVYTEQRVLQKPLTQQSYGTSTQTISQPLTQQSYGTSQPLTSTTSQASTEPITQSFNQMKLTESSLRTKPVETTTVTEQNKPTHVE